MKVASYNLENLFNRAKVFDEKNSVSQKILKKVAELNILFDKENYTKTDQTKMIGLLKDLGLDKTDSGTFTILRKIRGKIVKRPKGGGPIEIAAEGRDSWVGWVDLKTAPVNEIAILNTGKVISEVDADIIGIVEAENRVVLKQFNDYVITEVGGKAYPHVMLIDGNDDRGIDVGLMTKKGYKIGLMRSHVHDLNNDKTPIFSRDCPEYCITTPQNEKLWVLPNHFKSKFGGNDPKSQAKRKAQATRTLEIYKSLLNEGYENIIVMGDLNDTPDSESLQVLTKNTGLKDVSDHTKFDAGEYEGIGTFGLGNDGNKIDYILLSPALFARVTSAGLFRKGAWPGKKPARWEVFPELVEEHHAASDHHLIWCEID